MMNEQGAIMWRRVWQRPGSVDACMMGNAVKSTLERQGFHVRIGINTREDRVCLEIQGRREEFRQAMRHVPECGKTSPEWYRQERTAATLNRWRIQ